MALPVPTTIATGYDDCGGSDYRLLTDQLYIADGGAGTINALTAHTFVKTVLGTGFNAPSDVELSSDGIHAYVTENPGTLLKLSLTNMNRSAATVVASGFNGIDQVALDETHGYAYVAEFNAAQVQRVTLATGVKTVVASVPNPRGVAITSDGLFLYVSSDAGTITRFNFAAGTSTTIASGLSAPRHLTFADAGESVILFPQPNPTGTVLKADLTTTPATVTAIAGPTAAAPYSVTVLSPDQILVACATSIGEVNLTSSLITSAGPILLAIGFVPNDAAHLPQGYANTTIDPTYFYQVLDCPFGGTLPLMINWESARAAGGSFYQVFVGGVMITSPFADYLWSVPLSAFELQTTVPVVGYYPLRSAGQIWLNNWLGLLLDSTAFPNGLNTVSVKLFSAETAASQIGTSTTVGRFAALMIDNTQPTAVIEQILQQPGNVAVGTCAIVTTGTPTFTFQVNASAPAHLLAWSLTAYWGDNKSMAVSSDTYANHITPTFLWTGITGVAVPPPGPTPWNATVTGDPTSTHCAHSFFLYAWDRVIDGWSYIHSPASYQKSITIML
jgi:hypothetical protein